MQFNGDVLSTLLTDTCLAGRTAVVIGSSSMTSSTVAGRPVRPVDIAYGVRFLASDEAAFVHGTSLDVDGGITETRLG